MFYELHSLIIKTISFPLPATIKKTGKRSVVNTVGLYR